MSCSAMTEHYEEITVCGKPALFTNFRIKRDTVPDTRQLTLYRKPIRELPSFGQNGASCIES